MKCKSLLIGTSLLLLLAACSGDNQTKTPPSTPVKAVPSPAQSSLAVEPAQERVEITTDGSCRSIAVASCISCHSESRMCQKLGKKSESRWKRTIDRMIKHGLTMSASDQEKLRDCLVKESADIVQMCK